ncbi:30S ribosomal protein S17 [archaeon]|jgi:small subunit ribosomal protein S17|nr:30S ribosomal protein S17 [archaeon]MBT6824003.1 30S ribosomal protein S17 [archaeon]MBT7107236.1 30S ribosomal protein S17 [archaeon]MBT7297157.1 30S ribosomal protein S17 [archaeon]
MKKQKSIGFDVKFPKETCSDSHCPFHGELGTRGRTFTGTVTSKDLHKTARIEWNYKILIPKYERYVKKTSFLNVHNSPCIDAKVGDKVMVAECRPISKTKKFVIIKIINKLEK